jgi:mannose-1-phosphate guanylyltransferase/phosphomannomutase
MTFFKALELLAVSGRRLSEIVDGLPPVHMARRDVPTPWQQKGAVMREVASSAGPSRLMLLDGVKVIEKDRWALVIPLADEPVCRIWTEASSPQGAEALADRYADVRRVGRASALVDLSTSK